MKYPRINKKTLDSVNRKRFDSLFEKIFEQIKFDNIENGLGIKYRDIELLAWNSATVIISQPY